MELKTKKSLVDEVNEIINMVGSSLISLRDRWADEKEYEDIKDYQEVVQKLIVNYPILKMSKAPFGFVINVQGRKIHFFVKVKGNQGWVSAKSVS